MSKLMTANEAYLGLDSKMAAKGLPPGLFQGILDALMKLFQGFCPAMSPSPEVMETTCKDGLKAFQKDQSHPHRTVLRWHLREPVRQEYGAVIFHRRELDFVEGVVWEIGAEASPDERVNYHACWLANKNLIPS